MPNKLVIVESPSKSKTISKYLGKDYLVTSSKGHIRELSKTGKGRLGVNLDDGMFTPHYVDSKEKKDVIKELKADMRKLKIKADDCDRIYLATDPDREGEAIAWHLTQVLKIDPQQCHRVAFHEITKGAVNEAIEHPTVIDMDLVHSQETRRVLDRIIGFKLSGLLQKKKISKSAGRVQSVALKLIVDKEREIQAFIPEEYWEIEAQFEKDKLPFKASLVTSKDMKISNEQQANEIYNQLKPTFDVAAVEKKKVYRQSKAPFITSTLQQEASTKLGFNARKTMSLAQKLYEGIDLKSETVGLITYMRTDSIRLSDVFIQEAHRYIEDQYGAAYLGKTKVSRKTENVQDAHEAIRPTSVLRTPESVKKFLKEDEFKLYSLIYARAMASLMAPAINESTTVMMDNSGFTFKTNGSVQVFDGFLKVYGPYDRSKDQLLPAIEIGEVLESQAIEKSQHFTNPPARFTEAKLIKTLEELGIGRPSTYATIIDTIVSRDYVEVADKRFIPTDTGFLANDQLQIYFNSIINVDYTKNMEEQLDLIAEGKDNYVHTVGTFWDDFKGLLEKATEEMQKVPDEKTGEQCPECGSDLVIRKGRYGQFVACGNFPNCKYVKKDEVEAPEKTGEQCPKCGSPMVKKHGRFGDFEACSNYPECKYIKPKDKSNSSKEPQIVEGVTCPNCGGQVIMKMGRYGQFMACINYPKCKTIIKQDKKKKVKKEGES